MYCSDSAVCVTYHLYERCYLEPHLISLTRSLFSPPENKVLCCRDFAPHLDQTQLATFLTRSRVLPFPAVLASIRTATPSLEALPCKAKLCSPPDPPHTRHPALQYKYSISSSGQDLEGWEPEASDVYDYSFVAIKP